MREQFPEVQLDHLWFWGPSTCHNGSMEENRQPQIPALGSGFAAIFLPKNLRSIKEIAFLNFTLWLPVGKDSLGWNFICREK